MIILSTYDEEANELFPMSNAQERGDLSKGSESRVNRYCTIEAEYEWHLH